MTPTSLLSVEQVAEILKLHVRTIRNYVRSGALKATRIGKQYRIALGDLEAFSGQPVENHDERVLAPGGRVEVSGVINVAGVTPALASRLTNTLMATAINGIPHMHQRSISRATGFFSMLSFYSPAFLSLRKRIKREP